MHTQKALLSLILSLLMLTLWAVPALAATDADVTVTYTVEYIAITDNTTSVGFGVIVASATPSPPTDHIAITNDSSVQVDATISVTGTTWTGGTAHTHSDTATPGANTVGLKANRGGTWGVSDIIVKYDTPNFIYENCAAGVDFAYGLKLYAPTSSSDGVQKSNTVRVTVASG